MKAIILAAGSGTRLLHLTKDIPKCKVKVRGKPIIEHALHVLEDAGIKDVSIVKGFLHEEINYPNTKSYYNYDYEKSHILSSLMSAAAELDGEVIIVYADILFDRGIVLKLMQAKGDFCLVVDGDWRRNYVNRKLHPVEQAEKVIFTDNKIENVGKHLPADDSQGEFIGMLKLSGEGCRILQETYQRVFEKKSPFPFHEAQSLEKASLTDIFQELIENGYTLIPAIIKNGWCEIDTIEDLKRAGGDITVSKITPEVRRGLLYKTLQKKNFIRAIEAHNGISAIIANNAIKHDTKDSFDALWISSLTESASKGQPDIEIMGFDSRLSTVSQILEVTNLPLIIDGDTGGDINAFEYFVRKAESLGVSAIIIEDKVYPKRNSLDQESRQILEDPGLFSHKIRRGKHALLTNDFLIIARIESLIAGKGVSDALLRARCYLEAGADGIMIHSKMRSPDEVLSFARGYKDLTQEIGLGKPLVCVPTRYNSITESELKEAGFSIVIHANHLLRAAIRSMQKVCEEILRNGRTLEADQHCSSVEEIFDLVGFSDIKNKEKHYPKMWGARA